MKYLSFFCVIFFCNYINASTKEEISELRCPYTLPPENALPSNWITIGKASKEKLKLRTIGIIYADSSDIKNRSFSEDMIDEWEDLKDKSKAIAENDADHGDMMMKCVYAKSVAEDSDHNLKNVVLLIPLPIHKPVSCLLTRRNIDPTHEISCKVK